MEKQRRGTGIFGKRLDLQTSRREDKEVLERRDLEQKYREEETKEKFKKSEGDLHINLKPRQGFTVI